MSLSSGLNSFQKKIMMPLSRSRLAVPLSIASVVGVLTGFLIVGFIFLIDWTERLFLGQGTQLLRGMGRYAIIFIPAAGGLLIGLLTRALVPGATVQGVPEVLKAIALKGGKLPVLNVICRGLTSVLAIGSGFSVGREGPAVHIGAGVGSNIARAMRLGDMKMKNLAACGAAAGIAAVFNAPITGVMFALEVLLRDFGARALSTVVVAAVASSIVSRVYLGAQPAFAVPVYSLWNPLEIFIYMGLGVLSAFTALAFIQALDQAGVLLQKRRIPRWLLPALGGLAVGTMGVFVPQVLGMGFHVIEDMLHGSLPITMLACLVVLKILATSVSLGSGSSGGTFAPTLFVGGALGGLVGKLVEGRMPFETAPPGAYALVGMASVFAGSFHAPVTAILLVFEMTGDYKLILPLMGAAVISASLAQALKKESIDTVSLKREGIDLESVGSGVSFLGAMQVRDAMNTNFQTVPRGMNAKELLEKMSKEKEKTFFVVNSRDEMVGMIRPKNVQEILLEKNMSLIIADDIATPVYEICSPDEPLSEAAHLMKLYNITQLPVMNPAEPRKIIGLLKSEDVFRAYTDLAVKRDELISRMEQEGSYAEGAINLRFKIPQNSPMVGKFIRELVIPDGVVLTSLQRKNVTVIPEGHTKLQAKDKIWAVVLGKSEKTFRDWLKENKIR